VIFSSSFLLFLFHLMPCVSFSSVQSYCTHQKHILSGWTCIMCTVHLIKPPSL
jgi:hypothetical protein